MSTSLASSVGPSLATSLAKTSVDYDEILLALGSSLLYWFEPRSNLILLNGSNLSRIFDVRETDFVTPTRPYLDQATAGNQPAWAATGGAGGRPAVVIQAVGRYMTAAGATWLSGARRGIYVVAAASATNSRAYASNISVSLFRGTDTFSTSTNFAGGSNSITVSSPAIDTNHHLHAVRSESTSGGLNRYQIDGANTTPNFTRTDGFAAQSNGVRLGQNTLSGGTVSAIIITSDPVDATNDVVKAYSAAQFSSLSLS